MDNRANYIASMRETMEICNTCWTV